MCRVTEFELDKALDHIRQHAPQTTLFIERYIEQLRRKMQDDIETMRMAGVEAVGMITCRTGMEPYAHINKTARTLLEKKG